MDNIESKAKELQTELIGPDYNYGKYIPTPGDLGVSGSGNFGALIRDISASIKYMQVLTFGSPPLGYNFFLKSGKCSNDEQGNSCYSKPNSCVDRYIYVRNIPSGRIPGLSNMGLGNTSFKGLVPGFAENAEDLVNVPNNIWNNLSGKGPQPPNKCKKVTRSVGPSGNTRPVTKWVPIVEPFINRKKDTTYIIFILIAILVVFIFLHK